MWQVRERALARARTGGAQTLLALVHYPPSALDPNLLKCHRNAECKKKKDILNKNGH
jgi:hypothetical protein